MIKKTWLIEENNFNIIKAIHTKPTGNIITNGERVKIILLRSETRQGCPFSPLLFFIVLEVLDRVLNKRKKEQEKEEKDHEEMDNLSRSSGSGRSTSSRRYPIGLGSYLSGWDV
jgi:hypothetical protein